MDCDTTGIEPDLALVKFKKLVGGGSMQIVNQTVPRALKNLGYPHEQVEAITEYIAEHGHVVDAPGLRPEHYDVFDCAMGERAIRPMGHVKMMAATQPFLSGAISKTVNLPTDCTVDDIAEAYTEAWRLGLKAVAIYRDGSKTAQALRTDAQKDAPAPAAGISEADVDKAIREALADAPPKRRRMPRERQSLTHKFSIGGHEGYITVGLYPSGEPGELFITMAKEGSTVSGLMDSFALAVSIALQHGVPLKLFCEKFAHTRFEPSGWSGNPDIGYAKSIMDYIFRWLQMRFLTGQQQMLFENLRLKPAGVSPQPSEVGDMNGAPAVRPTTNDQRPTTGSIHAADALSTLIDLGDAPSCSFCGSIMTRNGSCYRCMSCGSTSGCS